MTTRAALTLTVVAMVVAPGATTAVAAPCLAVPRPWYAGHLGALSATPEGQAAATTVVAKTAGVPAIRVTPRQGARPGFLARLTSNTWSMESDLELGRYVVELVVVTLRWPEEGTAVHAVENCEAEEFEVTRALESVWAPRPQVFVETLGRQVEAGIEWFAVRWGASAIGGHRVEPVSPAGWHLRGEIRRNATRGYLAFGIRADREGGRWPVGLTGGFGIELPPFGRRPVWVVGEAHARRWTGDWHGWRHLQSYWSAFEPLGSLSLGIRIDGRRVKR